MAWPIKLDSGNISSDGNGNLTVVSVSGNIAANALKTTGSPVNVVSTPPTSGQVLTATSSTTANWATPSAGTSGANPTATIGLTAINGSATTFLRSDGAPLLSQSIAPTWTGGHIFSPSASTIPLTIKLAASQSVNSFQILNSSSAILASFNKDCSVLSTPNNFTIGSGSVLSTGTNNLSIGGGSIPVSTGNNNTAIGSGANITSVDNYGDSVALGINATARDNLATAIGAAYAGGARSTAVGYLSTTNGNDSFACAGGTANGADTIALGGQTGTSQYATSIGGYSNAAYGYSVSIGANSATFAQGDISLGSTQIGTANRFIRVQGTDSAYNPADMGAIGAGWLVQTDGAQTGYISLGGSYVNNQQVCVRCEAYSSGIPKMGFFGAAAVVQPAAITAPTGGAIVDTQARAAIVSILNALGATAGGIGITA